MAIYYANYTYKFHLCIHWILWKEFTIIQVELIYYYLVRKFLFIALCDSESGRSPRSVHGPPIFYPMHNALVLDVLHNETSSQWKHHP